MMDEFATDLEILVPMAATTLDRSLPKLGFHPSRSLPLLVNQ
jgi:hypothetical protein